MTAQTVPLVLAVVLLGVSGLLTSIVSALLSAIQSIQRVVIFLVGAIALLHSSDFSNGSGVSSAVGSFFGAS